MAILGILMMISGFIGVLVCALIYHEMFFEWIDEHMPERKV